MKQAKFNPVGDARTQSRLLERIPEPTDEAFRAAAQAALVQSNGHAQAGKVIRRQVPLANEGMTGPEYP